MFRHHDAIIRESTVTYEYKTYRLIYKACPSESGNEFGAPLFPAVELCDFPGRWQCMSGEIWYTLDSGSVLLPEAEARQQLTIVPWILPNRFSAQ